MLGKRDVFRNARRLIGASVVSLYHASILCDCAWPLKEQN